MTSTAPRPDGVFLDSAGSSLPSAATLDAVVSHLRREAEVGGYRAAEERAEDLADLRSSLARLLGCAVGELFLGEGSTRVWNQLVGAFPLRAGDRVLVTGSEYVNSAVSLLRRSRRDGVVVDVVPSRADGTLDPDALAGMLDERVRLVSLVHVPTSSGLVNPVRVVADLAHAAGVPVLLDACQSAGQLALDVASLGVDALTTSGRKWLRGPRGTGFAWVSDPFLDLLDPYAGEVGASDWTAPLSYVEDPAATRFELWECDVAGRLGLRVAVDELLARGQDATEREVRERAALFRALLADVDGVSVHDPGPDLAGIVTFTVAGAEPATVVERLRADGVTVKTSTARAARIDAEQRGLDAVVRASPHYFVTPEQLERAARAVRGIARRP